MSEQIREQVSAFLDGELPGSETELLLKRLLRDKELRNSFGRYALVGECLRGGSDAPLSWNFGDRVNQAIDGGARVPVEPVSSRPRVARWWRPFAGAAVAAGVAAVAVFALQQRAVAPGLSTAPVTAQNIETDAGKPREALSYTVPAAVSEAPTGMPAARLTNYVFAHSRYSSGVGQENALSGLLTPADEPVGTPTPAPSTPRRSRGTDDGTP